jgi:D-mannonate dehydratase
MKLSFLFFGNKPDEKWHLAKQMGVNFAIAKLAPELTGDLPPYDFDSLKKSKEIYEANGFNLYGLEGDQFDMNRIKFGLPGRDEDIELYKKMLINMGQLGVQLLCYNFMAGIGWFRTKTDFKERAGALVSGFNIDDANKMPLTEYGIVPEEKIWDNYIYFIEQVIPVAEKAGVKMALHPDDPPVSPLRGIGRIFINADCVRKALALSNSPSHGLTFCKGTYTTMGENVEALIEEFKERIHFVHIRDIKGTANNFRETFHDNGPTDMFKMMKAYKAIGFNGPLRSDHVPTMYGESNYHSGYEMNGNLFGVGYIKGLIDGVENDF